MSDDRPSAPAGWYPDDNGQMRYWDGSHWLSIPPPPSSPEVQHEVPRRQGSRRRSVIAISLVVLIALAIGGGLLAWKIAADAEVAAAEAAAMQKAEEAEEAAKDRAEAESEREAAADRAERSQRAESVEDIEASVMKMAKEHAADDIIDGPILDVACSPVDGGSTDDLTETTTVFQCFASYNENDDGTSSGYYYNATMNWDTGSYTYGFGQP